MLRESSERVIESMLATFQKIKPGMTKYEMVDTLKREEVNRGLTFEYCLNTAGSSLNRAPSDQKLQKGDIISLDSGGNYHGYIGDLCRMAILQGKPDAELQDLLGLVEEIQQEARKPSKPGAHGGEIVERAEKIMKASPHAKYMEFLAHGMGLVTHEAPRLTNSGPVPYTDDDAHRPLESGMVISVETTLLHPRRGFIKLEDTVAVTDAGYEVYGDRARGWLRGGAAL